MVTCECNVESWYAPDAAVIACENGDCVRVWVVDDALARDTPTRVRCSRTADAAGCIGPRGWVDVARLHRPTCDRVTGGFNVVSCARCRSWITITAEIVECGRCRELWVSDEAKTAAGWILGVVGDDVYWFPPRYRALKLTDRALARILDAHAEGRLADAVRLRSRCYATPKSFREGVIGITEPIADCRGSQWGTVNDLVVKPFFGHTDTRNLVIRSRSNARWGVVVDSVVWDEPVGELTLVSAYHDAGRSLAVVDTARRVPDKQIDREVAATVRKYLRGRL